MYERKEGLYILYEVILLVVGQNPTLQPVMTKVAFMVATFYALVHPVTGYGNFTAPDDDSLSSYARSKTCSPGPRLAAFQKEGAPFVPFVTLTEAHSGSTWFRTMLNSHPCVRSHGETLRHRNELKNLWATLSKPTKTDPKDGPLNPALFAAGLKGFFTPSGPQGQRHDFNPTNKDVYDPVSKFLKTSKAGVVIWLRRNPFDRFLSFAREKEIGQPHCQAKVGCDLGKVQALTYTLPLDRMVAFLDTAERNDAHAAAMLRSLGRPVLEVHYEDLIGHPDEAKAWWGTILQFVGISRLDVGLLSSEWRRQIVKGHSETVANYRDVKQKLEMYKGGKYLDLL